jgi:MFS transporter, DHA3 family, macrolide efflux protein
MTSTAKSGFHANLELFKNRDFAILWAGYTFSGLGDAVYFITRLTLMIKLTGSALAAGGMTIFGILPTILMSLTGGALADRFDRQKMVIWSNFARGVLMVGLAWLIDAGLVQYWHLYVVAFINNSFFAISNPAFDAMLPSVVKTEQLKHAYSSFSMGSNFAQIAGPALAGFFMILSGTAGAMLINGISFFAMMVALLFIHPEINKPKSPQKDSSIFADILQGWHYVRQNKILMIYLFGSAFLLLLSPAFFVGIPFFITKVLKLNISWYSTVAVGVNIGVILGSLLASIWNPKSRGLTASFGYIIVGISTIITFIFMKSIWFAVINMIFINIILGLIGVFMPAWVQTTVTDEFRGRVFSIISMISYSLTPVGLIVIGFLLDHFDPGLVIAVSGLGFVGVGFWMLTQKPMRELL